jgi:hypothetical protein
VQWNIWSQRTDVALRLNGLLAATIGGAAPADVVALQEVTKPALALILAHSGVRRDYLVTGIEHRVFSPHGVAYLIRRSWLNRHGLELAFAAYLLPRPADVPGQRRSAIRCQRTLVVATFYAGDRIAVRPSSASLSLAPAHSVDVQLRIGSAHFLGGLGTDDEPKVVARRAQLALAAALVAPANDDAPGVILCDSNIETPAELEPYVGPSASRPSPPPPWLDAYAAQHEGAEPNVLFFEHPTYGATYPDARMSRPRRIDYALLTAGSLSLAAARAGLEPCDAGPGERLECPGLGGRAFPSDHCGILVDAVLLPRPAATGASD